MRKYNTEDIIELFKKIHGDKYLYDKFIYTKMHDKGIITCPIHGDFEQDAHSHLKGQGCPKCAILSRSKKRQDTIESFIEKSKRIHGDKYSYDNVIYKSSQSYVMITCPIHGDFKMKPYLHIQGKGCSKCFNEKRKVIYRKPLDKFKSELKELYGDKYILDNINYVNFRTKVELCCKEHGTFFRTPYELLNKKHCPICMENDRTLKRQEKYLDKFIKEATIIHNAKYSYDKVEYKDANTPVEIICPIHGSFFQKPSYHLCGNGCQQCAKEMISSKDEIELYDFISTFENDIIKNDRKILNNNFELDIYIPNKKIAIEYDGLFWHSELKKSDKNYHLDKTNKCLEKGIRLIHIFEDEWLYKKNIVKSRLKNILGLNDNKIYARKCLIKEVPYNECNDFLNSNHIQGMCVSKYRYGLYHNDELVSLMTFGSLRKNLNGKGTQDDYELLRFCNKLDTSVIGGASKLLKHFIKTINPKKIISYADRRWSDGHLYEVLGFTHTHDSQPNYYYVIGDRRSNRFNYRKDVLVKQGFDKDKSEHEIMLERNIYRIYDCGAMCFEMKLKE